MIQALRLTAQAHHLPKRKRIVVPLVESVLALQASDDNFFYELVDVVLLTLLI